MLLTCIFVSVVYCVCLTAKIWVPEVTKVTKLDYVSLTEVAGTKIEYQNSEVTKVKN